MQPMLKWGVLNNHEISLGFNIFEYVSKKPGTGGDN